MPLFSPPPITPVVTPIAPDSNSGFSSLIAKMPQRTTNPVIWVACGSSTTMSASLTEEERYPYKVLVELRKEYPASVVPAVRTLASAVGTPPTGPGIHLINAGVSGTQSSTYLTSTTRPQVYAMNPDVITHMIGANDYGNGVSVATYKANILTQLTEFDTLGYKKGHVFFHSYPRYDAAAISARVAPWDDYLKALREIAAQRKDISVIDLSRDFAAIGIPNTDPLGFMNADLIHLVAIGQTFLATLITQELLGSIPSVSTSGGSGGGTPTRAILTSDAFSGATAASMSGKSTDATLGGTTLAWESAAITAWGINASKQLYSSAATTSFLAIPITTVDQAFSFTVPTLTDATGTVLQSFDFRRAGLATGTDCYRLRMRADGSMSLHVVTGGTENTTALASAAAGTLTPGAIVDIDAQGSKIIIKVGSTTVIDVSNSLVVSSAYAGFTKSSTVATAIFDNFIAYTYTGSSSSLWVGTQAEYDAIPTKNSNTLYAVNG